jgi:uroporphyrinogen III methyltransferase / synthase
LTSKIIKAHGEYLFRNCLILERLLLAFGTPQLNQENSMAGKVYLVGAGPGDGAYLTVRAQQLLAQADALVYDALIDSRVLQGVKDSCSLIWVGKRGGEPSVPQADINQTLVTLCQQGKTVVRLKSGDPFVFGRAAAELQALRQANCPFEIVPGISSALVAPMLAGIPLTDPVLGRGFGVFSAHDVDALNWSALAGLDTIIFLMGGQVLADICQRLVRHEKRGDTPVAIIQWASQPQQKVWIGTLLSIVQQTKGVRLSPCIIVIGQVVGLRDFLRSPMDVALPLKSKTVLVTRAAEQASQFSELLQAQGATVIDMPALEIHPPSSWQALDAALDRLAQFDWLILTSANAVTFFLERLLARGQDLRALAGLKIAVVGKKTATVLTQRGLQADFVPPNYVADALVETFPVPVSGLQILFPRVESGGREILVKTLTEQGANVTEVAAYESACPYAMNAVAKEMLATHQVQVVTFASSKTVRYFAQLMTGAFGPDWLEALADVAVASIGPQTSQTCHEILHRVDIEAQEYTLDGLTQAIVAWTKCDE